MRTITPTFLAFSLFFAPVFHTYGAITASQSQREVNVGIGTDMPLVQSGVQILQKAFTQNQLPEKSLEIPGKILLLVPERSTFMDAKTFEELNLSDVIQSFASTCKTPWGGNGLTALMYTVTRDEAIKRSDVVRSLTNTPSIHDALRATLEKIGDVSSEFESYWGETNLQRRVAPCYFSWPKKLNYHSKALSLATSAELGKGVVSILTPIIIAALVQEYARSYNAVAASVNTGQLDPTKLKFGPLAHVICSMNFKKAFAGFFAAHNPQISDDFAEKVTGAKDKDTLDVLEKRAYTLGDKVLINERQASILHGTSIQEYEKKVNSWIKTGYLEEKILPRIYRWGEIAFIDFALGTAIVSEAKKFQSMIKAPRELHEHMKKIAVFFRNIDLLAEHISQIPELSATDSAKTITAFCQGCIQGSAHSPKMRQFLALIKGPLFAENRGAPYVKGKVLVANLLLSEIKDELIPLVKAIAEIDAYTTAAHCVLSTHNAPVQFCVPEFIQSETPVLHLEGFWNPRLVPETAQINSITLGNTAPHNALFTGPNWSGKSTNSRALAYAIALSAWGIAPAHSAIMTPFDTLIAYVNPHEDITRGMSSFSAKLKRFKEIEAAGADQQKQVFMLLDEPLTSTVDSEGELRVTEFGRKLGTQGNCMIAMVTHYKNPLELSKEGIFAPFNIEVVEESDTFKRTFKLLEGPATWWFEDTLRRARFISWIAAEQGISF